MRKKLSDDSHLKKLKRALKSTRNRVLLILLLTPIPTLILYRKWLSDHDDFSSYPTTKKTISTSKLMCTNPFLMVNPSADTCQNVTRKFIQNFLVPERKPEEYSKAIDTLMEWMNSDPVFARYMNVILTYNSDFKIFLRDVGDMASWYVFMKEPLGEKVLDMHDVRLFADQHKVHSYYMLGTKFFHQVMNTLALFPQYQVKEKQFREWFKVGNSRISEYAKIAAKLYNNQPLTYSDTQKLANWRKIVPIPLKKVFAGRDGHFVGLKEFKALDALVEHTNNNKPRDDWYIGIPLDHVSESIHFWNVIATRVFEEISLPLAKVFYSEFFDYFVNEDLLLGPVHHSNHSDSLPRNFDKCEAAATAVIEEGINTGCAYSYRAQTAYLQGHYRKAVAYYQSAIENNFILHPDELAKYAHSLYEEKDFAAAIKVCKQAQKDPHINPEENQLCGNMLAELNEASVVLKPTMLPLPQTSSAAQHEPWGLTYFTRTISFMTAPLKISSDQSVTSLKILVASSLSTIFQPQEFSSLFFKAQSFIHSWKQFIVEFPYRVNILEIVSKIQLKQTAQYLVAEINQGIHQLNNLNPHQHVIRLADPSLVIFDPKQLCNNTMSAEKIPQAVFNITGTQLCIKNVKFNDIEGLNLILEVIMGFVAKFFNSPLSYYAIAISIALLHESVKLLVPTNTGKRIKAALQTDASQIVQSVEEMGIRLQLPADALLVYDMVKGGIEGGKKSLARNRSSLFTTITSSIAGAVQNIKISPYTSVPLGKAIDTTYKNIKNRYKTMGFWDIVDRGTDALAYMIPGGNIIMNKLDQQEKLLNAKSFNKVR